MSPRNLCDYIEKYIRDLLESSEGGLIEIRRNSLAERLGCSPSAITYVLETRFRVERGYVVESRRGGGGYIRVVKAPSDSIPRLLDRVASISQSGVTQDEALGYVDFLLEEGVVSSREADLMRVALCAAGEGVDRESRNHHRGRVLIRLLSVIAKWMRTEAGASAGPSGDER